MKTMEMTTMSSKGQVVIPADIRDRIGLSSGTKLMILMDGDNLLLKPVQTPKMEVFRALVKRSRRWAKEAGKEKRRSQAHQKSSS
ncbi:MAG: AbrB/MazE/SpoVT family DNA-binding domain-containing protein [Elusimicrobia bacterium]|nr:AbrB/MazE/SpoVT family DNA-binding domain-containing protein [Elusimicrobiota bacterium]